MSILGDIITVAKDIEGRAKDRRDIDALHQIHSLALSLQKQHTDIIDRADRIQSENTELKRQLAETNTTAEDKRFHRGIDFRKGRRTGGQWQPFCPKCELPVNDIVLPSGDRWALCSAHCGWTGQPLEKEMAAVIAEISA
jgi:hypothetical protein